MELQLRISESHHTVLINHLLPSDGKEAVAVALCGRHDINQQSVLTIYDINLIPYDECYSREYDFLNWPTNRVIPYFERISKSDMAILKIHSHPGGYEQFSQTDNISDKEFFDSVFGWAISDKPHASAVMLPGGKIFGRFFFSDLTNRSIDKVLIVGETIVHYNYKDSLKRPEFAKRTIQAFGEKTYEMLSLMTIGVVGCSGTGSPVIEQLVRLGVGKLILIDPDVIELKNINRILNSSVADAQNDVFKVDMLKTAIQKIGLNTEVETFNVNLYDSVIALKRLATCDIIFGCMDSVDGRYLLNQLSTYYLIPYFDLGVKLEASNNGGIKQICGSVHYLQPGRSSLLTRGVYNMDDLKAASQLRKNPEEYKNLIKNSYIKNINVNNPAVISVNMQIASHAINEFLNRIHPYKVESPNNYAACTIDVTESYIVNSAEDTFEVDTFLNKKLGRGTVSPFLDIVELYNEEN